MPFPWMVWVFGYPTFPNATKGDEISIPPVQSISKNRNQSDDFCDWAGICSSSYRLSGCSDWWWLLIFKKKEWLEKKHRGGRFFERSWFDIFQYYFCYTELHSRKGECGFFKENYSVSVGNTFTTGELSIVISRLPDGIEIPIILMNLLLSHVFQECCIGYKRSFSQLASTCQKRGFLAVSKCMQKTCVRCERVA